MNTSVRKVSAVEVLETRIAPAAFIVNSLLDGAPTKDGNLTLREAIEAATTNAASGDAPAGSALADTITFAPRLAGGSILLTGELSIGGGGQLSITGPGTSVGAIALFAAANSRVFSIADTGDAVLLSHLTIRGGNIAGSGGGIFNQGNLYLDDVLVTKNAATSGGGIANSGSAAKLSIIHSRIEENTAGGNNGGGILNTAGAQLTIRDMDIASNFARQGGGLFNATGSTAAISASEIAGNRGDSSGDGAGIFNDGTLTLDETTVSGNVGLGFNYFGGGIRSNGTLTVLNSTISGNLSQGTGGGIDATAGTLTIINSTIANNTALGSTGGGGIRTNAATTITNSTIAGNIDATAGGAGAGGILVSTGNPLLVNTVVAGNLVTSGTSADLRGSFSAGSANNFIGVGDGATGLVGANDNQIGTSAAPLDAKLGPLQDNGGRTLTMLPLSTSPLIDAGSNDAAISAFGSALRSDQRGPGFARTIEFNVGGGATVDIGAVEFAGFRDASGVTSFTFTNIGGTKINVVLTGGGTFDVLRDSQGTTFSRLEVHGATAASALAVKVLTPGGTWNVDGILADGPLKSITFGKGVQLTGTISVDGALASLALDTMADGSFIRTGGTPAQTLKITANGDFKTAIDTTSAVSKLSLPKFTFAGSIRAAAIGDITALSFSGGAADDPFNNGDNRKHDLIATQGPIGKLTAVTGRLDQYEIVAGPGGRGTLGGLSVTSVSDVFGITRVSVTAAQIGPISVKVSAPAGGFLPVRGIVDSSFTATNGGIASVAVSLSSTPPNVGSFGINDSAFTAAAGIGNVTVTSKDPDVGTITGSTFIAGTKTLATWTSLANASLQLAALKSSSIGSISAIGSISGSKFIAAGNIGAINAPASFSNSLVLAGASLGADGAFGGTGANQDFYVRPVSIGALTLKQPVASTISAGIDPNDGVFGDNNDELGAAGLVAGSSKIGPIKITASFNFNPAIPALDHTFAIQAGAIAKIVINGQNAIPSATGVALDTDAGGTDTATDIVIRTL